MASAPPARIETIGRAAGADHDLGFTFEESLVWTGPLKLSEALKVPIVKNVKPGDTGASFIADFPLVEPTGLKLHHWADVVHPFEEAYDVKKLEELFLANRYTELPGKIRINVNARSHTPCRFSLS